MQSVEEARLAIEAGASLLGFVGRMPSGFGPIDDERIREIVATVPPGVTTVLLTSERTVADIAAHHARVRTGAVQICDRLEGNRDDLRHALPGVRIIQVVHVTGPAAIDEALDAARGVDALLLDSGNPDRATKELGGTGRVHDWALSRRIRERVDVPVFLAGGLVPENVAEAVREVRPFGIDACTGLRVDGRLDPERLRTFVEASRGVGNLS
jgi:phosphoribosylanthranilate isomerase